MASAVQPECCAIASWADTQAAARDRRATFSGARLLILNARGGYHIVAGMDRISVDVGHSA
jgi:hypothetical protein